MRERARKLFAFLLLLPVVALVGIMMKSGSPGIESAGNEFQNLALKMSLIRVVVVGGMTLFGWRMVTRFCGAYFRVEIGGLKYRVLCWYLAAESVVVASLFWT